MPFSPSDLPWWGWLLISAGFLVVALIASLVAENSSSYQIPAWLIAVGSFFGVALSGTIGVVRFVKWIWNA